VSEFCVLIDKVHKDGKVIKLYQTYKSLGKMELINSLIEDDNHNFLLKSGKKVLEKNIKSDK